MFSGKPGISVSGCKTSLKKRPSSFMYLDEDVNEEDLGAETEAEKQMKVLLEKQLNTKLSIKDQFAQHRTFSCPSTYNSLTELVKGTCTLEQFKEIEKDEELHQEFQRCGLTEEEIMDYFMFKCGKEKRKGNYSIDPLVWENKMKTIEEKIKDHNKDLLKPQAFKNVKKLTRHEMEIEKSLYVGCPDKSKLSALVSLTDDNEHTEVNDAFNHIKKLSQKLLQSRRKKKKTLEDMKQNTCELSTDETKTENSSFIYDSNIHHVVVPLEEQEIKEKQLTIDEIKSLPRFENYEIGDPSKTLYLKNLHPKITVRELRSVFGIFEEENKVPVDYKLCTGRMKGQAFIKFLDEKIAEKALKHANGYLLRGKPIIIAFGHKS